MSKWRNKVNIKDLFTNETTDEKVLQLSEVLNRQLKSILEKEKRENADEYFTEELEIIVDNFDWIIGGIKYGESVSDEFDSWLEAFNEYLTQLYDLGDTLVSDGDGSFSGREKFLWVG